ncbi:MAG: redoxin domain-containing protein [Chloroflexi bacterium]|nr:redoxin domain-containing protein [Chloroflexota bacterium]
MARFRDSYSEFTARGAELIAIGPDSLESFQRYWAKENIPFTGLPDHNNAVAKMYKQQVNLFKFGRMPLNCIIDTNGLMRFVYYSASRLDYPDIPTFLNVIDELKETSK